MTAEGLVRPLIEVERLEVRPWCPVFLLSDAAVALVTKEAKKIVVG